MYVLNKLLCSMQAALRRFAVRERALSPFLYNTILGHDTTPTALPTIHSSKRMSAPGLPELNHSQANAVRAVLARPLSLIQASKKQKMPFFTFFRFAVFAPLALVTSSRAFSCNYYLLCVSVGVFS